MASRDSHSFDASSSCMRGAARPFLRGASGRGWLGVRWVGYGGSRVATVACAFQRVATRAKEAPPPGCVAVEGRGRVSMLTQS